MKAACGELSFPIIYGEILVENARLCNVWKLKLGNAYSIQTQLYKRKMTMDEEALHCFAMAIIGHC